MNKKSRIRNAEPHLALIGQGESFHVVHDVTNESDERLKQTGFLNLEDGECVLPRALGSVTKRNCNGYDIVFKDRAKEQYIIYFTVPGWHNTYHTASLERWRYPREHRAGYEMELTLMLKDGKRYVVSPELVNVPEESDRNKHALNLFLELFGGFEFMNENMESVFRDMRITRVNWTLLPIGEFPFERLEREILNYTGRMAKRVFRHTDSVIRRYNPEQCVVGNGGFRNYVAFLFPERNLTVLECFEPGNATYVFNKDWEELSRKTKAQILGGDLALARIIHKDSWETEIRNLFGSHLPNA